MRETFLTTMTSLEKNANSRNTLGCRKMSKENASSYSQDYL